MNRKYQYISDPGHGWLKVPMEEVKDLKISSCSYMHAGYSYLEEDCDAQTFLDHLLEQGDTAEFTQIYQKNTPIRGYETYRRQHHAIIVL